MATNLEKVLTEARKWVGYLEKRSDSQLDSFSANAGSNNYTCFARDYTKKYGFGSYSTYQAQPWCAMYVTVVFCNALGKENATKLFKGYAYCPYGVNDWKARGRWHGRKGYKPQPGDVIFFQSKGVACHTGIVYKADNSYVYTYEGNTSGGNTVIANGGSVCAKAYSLSNSRILGYGNPNWKLIEKPEKPTYWADEFLNKLAAKKIIEDKSTWKNYKENVKNSEALALLDKATGGKWTSEESNPSIHWAQPHVISLTGKKIISPESVQEWLGKLDKDMTNNYFLALIDKATGGTKAKYINRQTDNFGRNHLDSLCDKGIITTPAAWTNWDAKISRENMMTLVWKALYE